MTDARDNDTSPTTPTSSDETSADETSANEASAVEESTTPGLDAVPNGQGEDAREGDAENPPLPDWGPTDGEHGVDDDEPAVQ